MKAIVYTKYGSPDQLQLQEVPKPTPKDDEVLIKVHASSINSWDRDNLAGKFLLVRLISGLFRPKHKIPGADVAGVVASVGKNITSFRPGDEVIGDLAKCGFGCFAEYVTVPEKLLAHKSPKMTFEQAAALPQAGLLAIQGLRYYDGIQKGQEVLINGAAGGAGPMAIQYAKSIGCVVTAVDKTDKLEALQALGADHLIDYTRENYTKTGKQYDYILDLVAYNSIADYKRALKPGGTFAMVGGDMGGMLLTLMIFGKLISRSSNKNLGIMGYKPSREALEELNRLFENGVIDPLLDSSYALEDTADAFHYFLKNTFKGKVVIKVHS